MKARVVYIASIWIIISLLCPLLPGKAASGLPDSPQFGYGARLSISGSQINPAINLAAGIGMDWIAVEFDWERIWPDAGTAPDLSVLNTAMAAAEQGSLNVMISIANPPAWALLAEGPNPELTASLVNSLANLYPVSLKAVELYPGPNTLRGWKQTPNPQAYAVLLQTVYAGLQKVDHPVYIIAGGLTPLAPGADASDMNDLLFLQSLYQANALPAMQIIGVRLPDVSGDPMYVSQNGDQRYLRHYEAVRQVMLDNGHQNGLIWVTAFAWPDGTIQEADRTYTTVEEQAGWLARAYRLMRAQLYIGAAFFSSLNPAGTASQANSLLNPDGSVHPGWESLSQQIAINNKAKTIVFQGNISKKTPNKLALKP